MEPSETGNRMGHEFIGLVEAVGADVRTLKKGDLVVAPFAWSDGTCEFCRQGLQTSCLHGGWWGGTELDGGQGEAVRVPQADGTLVRLPAGRDDALMPSPLTLSDVMGTGHHAALAAKVGPGKIVAVVGRVQRWGDPVDEIRQGDVVWIPPGQKHWHGAGPETAMTHIARVELLDGKSTDWMEQVTDAQYAAPVRAQPPATAPRPTAGKQLMGDIAPKLAELTDDVLFGDVWERPGLSKRDRSLATVAALIAMNRPDQLRSHLARARENGVTEQELIEAITHPAFYAGWPSAVTAVGVAREVFGKK